MTTDDDDDPTTHSANEVITEAMQGCIQRGEGQGKCHVFVDDSDKCQCGERRLKRGTT